MRELALVGVVAILAGLASYYATGEFGWFNYANLGGGTLALFAAAALATRQLRSVGGPASRGVVLRGLARIAVAVVVAFALERAAASSGLQLDWTLEQSYNPAPAVREALAEMPGPLTATLFADPLDPRRRRTRLLLNTLAQHGDVRVRELGIEESPEEEDRFGIGSSNTVVLELGGRFETVERPTEGALFEALFRLLSLDSGTVVVLRGEGEGNVLRSDDLGYSGLAAALETEGYKVRTVVSAAMAEVPEGTDVVLVIAPERPLRAEAVSALERYVAGGGRLVAMIEPGIESGIESLLASWGLASPDRVIVDPASGSVENRPDGVCPVAFNYEQHPISRGLDTNRMTFFCGVRPFELRKPTIDDELRRVVLSSPRAWLSDDFTLLERRSGSPEANGAPADYRSMGVAGRYERDATEIRIVAFGDADFAANKNLRTLYNLDLFMNAIHWAAQHESRITFRPKIRDTVQFPLPLANTLTTLYGVGLLVPELLVIVGGLVWLRRRN